VPGERALAAERLGKPAGDVALAFLLLERTRHPSASRALCGH